MFKPTELDTEQLDKIVSKISDGLKYIDEALNSLKNKHLLDTKEDIDKLSSFLKGTRERDIHKLSSFLKDTKEKEKAVIDLLNSAAKGTNTLKEFINMLITAWNELEDSYNFLIHASNDIFMKYIDMEETNGN